MATYDLTGGKIPQIQGLTILRSDVVSVVGAAQGDVWNVFNLPAGTVPIKSVVEIVDNDVANSVYDVGYDGGSEFNSGLAGDADSINNDNDYERIESDVVFTVKLATAGSSPTVGSFRVVLAVANIG